VVVIDEAYGDFSDEDHWDFLKEFDNVIISRTLSKSYSLAGMRVGLAIAAPPLVAEMDKVRDSYNLDRVAQVLGTAALRNQAEFVPLWEKVRHTRTRLMEQLAKLDFQVCESDSNFVFAAPRWMAAADLYQDLKEKKILVRYFNHPRITDYLRITVGTDGEIDQLLSAIASLKGSLG
jgi:histidinol-phosphate aminotransferase